ncbi:MAG: CDGSH iron-sulfur domain-containing protein [Nitrospirota bacterium]
MSDQHPFMATLEAGTYSWCSCGRTKTPGFCDGSHKGTDKTPLEFVIKEKKQTAVCNCGRTKTPPFCDGTHTRP